MAGSPRLNFLPPCSMKPFNHPVHTRERRE
jgi:hypothetical protein